MSADLQTLLRARVLQAFLPKFENEGQDVSVAEAIAAGADERYVVITIKHSGSLVTMSPLMFGAKNSVSHKQADIC